jgi:hypothetical protein
MILARQPQYRSAQVRVAQARGVARRRAIGLRLVRTWEHVLKENRVPQRRIADYRGASLKRRDGPVSG